MYNMFKIINIKFDIFKYIFPKDNFIIKKYYFYYNYITNEITCDIS